MAQRVVAGKEATERKTRKPKQAVNLVNLIERFGSEDRCHAYLEGLRWPDGIECPRCQSKKISRISSERVLAKGRKEPRRQFDCDSCRYQFSVRVGTIFHDSHLPLWKWFLATYMIVESRKGISANQLKRTLNVSYKTAWYLCHRIRAAMKDDTPERFDGIVEIDETYVGGKAKSGSKKAQRAGAKGGTQHLIMVLGALEREGDLRIQVQKGPRTGGALQGFVRSVVEDDVEAIYTDQHSGYRSLGHPKHEFVDHTKDEWVRGDVTTNGIESAWSLFKRSLVGSYHQLSAKHLDAYLDEFAYRFNNRENEYLFRDTLLALIAEEPLRYKELIETPQERTS